MNLSRSDAAGGWIASARSLAKLLVRVDGFGGKPDILSSATISVMTTGSSANPGYAAGWFINRLGSGTWSHGGGLPGTRDRDRSNRLRRQLQLRDPDEHPAALPRTFFTDLDGAFWAALAATPQWPDVDLFRTR